MFQAGGDSCGLGFKMLKNTTDMENIHNEQNNIENEGEDVG